MHSRNFAHLDIKHDNIVLDDEINPKLADFGFTQHPAAPINTFAGAPYYKAPEINPKVGPYDGKKADIYAMGVVFYSLLMCCYPSDEKSPPVIENLKFPENISQMIIDIIKAMLSYNPNERPSA